MKRETKLDRRVRLISRLSEMGFTYAEAQTLRRIEMTLQRWAELECGDGNDFASWCVVRGNRKRTTPGVYEFTYDDNGTPFIERHNHNENRARYSPTPDRERGALKRLAKLMEAHPDYVAYHQGDPRGCALYIVPKAILGGDDINSVYSRGLAVCD